MLDKGVMYMEGYYTVSEYANITGKDTGNIRRKLIKGEIKGEKIGKQWLIPKDTIYPNDKRVKTGDYRNWRKKSDVNRTNPELMKALRKMCKDIGKVYGSMLDRIVLYGSYARGEETPDSDVDIALILKKHDTDEKHDAMTDIVIEHELRQGVTLSVISIEKKEMLDWNNVIPFYSNIDKEGIVLWKTA